MTRIREEEDCVSHRDYRLVTWKLSYQLLFIPLISVPSSNFLRLFVLEITDGTGQMDGPKDRRTEIDA